MSQQRIQNLIKIENDITILNDGILKTKILNNKQDSLFYARRTKEDNKNLEAVDRNLRKICGYASEKEIQDDEMIKEINEALTNLKDLVIANDSSN